MQVVQGLEWVKDNFVAPAVVVMALGGKPLQRSHMIVAGLAVPAKSSFEWSTGMSLCSHLKFLLCCMLRLTDVLHCFHDNSL